MAEKIALVSDATTRLGVTSELLPNKCITVAELEEMLSQKTNPIMDYLYKPGGLGNIMCVDGNMIVFNMTGKQQNVNGSTIQPQSNLRITSWDQVSIPSTCMYVGMNSYNEIRCDSMTSHTEIYKSSWKWIIIFMCAE